MADITITVPNAALPKLRQAFRGTTQAESLANVQAYLTAMLRQRVLEVVVAEARSAAQATVEIADSTKRTELATEWPG